MMGAEMWVAPSQDDLVGAYKLGMRRMAAAVCLMSQDDAGVRKGMAATAVTSLSVDPPSLLACVNRSASLNPTLQVGALFAVSVLSRWHETLASNFSSSELRHLRFTEGRWRTHALGVCYLEDAQCSFVCRVERRVEHFSHTIVIANVLDVSNSAAIDPLLYVDGTYQGLHLR
ncbi:MAG: flavin reductase [Rhizobiaceae bacterium]|nr:flavin reductase [Rhizobiaceae bacterium]